jgi:hypothetical protein
MSVPTYHIFSGVFLEKDSAWIDSVEGLGVANERMNALGREKPGPYFMFSTDRNDFFAIDTSITTDSTPQIPQRSSPLGAGV